MNKTNCWTILLVLITTSQTSESTMKQTAARRAFINTSQFIQSTKKSNFYTNPLPSTSGQQLAKTTSFNSGQKRAECSPPDAAKIISCSTRATIFKKDNDDEDVKFFQDCIANYYCFQVTPNGRAWSKLPSFRGLITTPYFSDAAKRVQLFFIRNNDWSQTIVNAKFRNVESGECSSLLNIIAARHMYVIYVLNLLRGKRTFAPCRKNDGKWEVPSDGECFLVPHYPVTCTSDFDIALLGRHSGSLTGLFNQFFREPLGTDPIVAGFGKSVEEVFDTNVQAFALEFAMPLVFDGLTGDFKTKVQEMIAKFMFKLQEIVTAILKMKRYNDMYFNDLMSDEAELRYDPSKQSLDHVFQTWVSKFQGLKNAIYSLSTSDQFNAILSLRRKHNMAHEMIMGLIETQGLSSLATKALSQNAIALMYAAEAYHTRGTIRHVVGLLHMGYNKNNGNSVTLIDCWVSMLENWADSVKEYNRKCLSPAVSVTVCLPKLAKYLWRMLDAMHRIRKRLVIENSVYTDLFEVDNDARTGVRSIVRDWLENVKNAGKNEISNDEQKKNPPDKNLDYFLRVLKCPKLQRHEPLTGDCMDAIQEEIRKYNRRLFSVFTI